MNSEPGKSLRPQPERDLSNLVRPVGLSDTTVEDLTRAVEILKNRLAEERVVYATIICVVVDIGLYLHNTGGAGIWAIVFLQCVAIAAFAKAVGANSMLTVFLSALQFWRGSKKDEKA